MNDDQLIERLAVALNGPIPDPSSDRIAAVRSASLDAHAQHRWSDGDVRSITTRRVALLTGAAAAVGAIGGVAATNGIRDGGPSAAEPVTEAITFTDGINAEPGTTVTGKVINHTWGVELLLDTTGLTVGSAYRVVYRDVDGAPVQAGGFVGTAVPIHCRCNAALLRDRISAIEIVDSADGVVSRAQFT